MGFSVLPAGDLALSTAMPWEGEDRLTGAGIFFNLIFKADYFPAKTSFGGKDVVVRLYYLGNDDKIVCTCHCM